MTLGGLPILLFYLLVAILAALSAWRGANQRRDAEAAPEMLPEELRGFGLTPAQITNKLMRQLGLTAAEVHARQWTPDFTRAACEILSADKTDPELEAALRTELAILDAELGREPGPAAEAETRPLFPAALLYE